jgi:GT2 family glycosyltransferase
LKLAFVILNYGTFKETTECVQSIKKHIDILEEEYHIVIVDNGSSDDSGVELKKEYQQEKNIDVILNPENIGFAKGNNIGIRYVNEKYEPEFIVVLNSDTELFQDDLYEKISTEYKHSHFGMLGPMMLTGDGRCNDSPWKPIEIAAVERRIQELKTEKKRILNRTIYIKKIIDKIKEKIGVANWQDYLHEHLEFWKYNTDAELQGAFLVFSKEIFNYIDGFDSRTFLYYEEQLLYLHAKRSGLPIVYDPRISVYHKDGCSSKKSRGRSREKMLFFNNCNLESLQYVLEELKKDNKK